MKILSILVIDRLLGFHVSRMFARREHCANYIRKYDNQSE